MFYANQDEVADRILPARKVVVNVSLDATAHCCVAKVYGDFISIARSLLASWCGDLLAPTRNG